MTTAVIPEPRQQIPRLGQKVRWRDPQQARASGWEALFGPGPFEVVQSVDKSSQGLAPGVIVRTELGEWEISEVWLAVAEEAGNDARAANQLLPTPASGRLPSGRRRRR
jgi:hypothetical protein